MTEGAAAGDWAVYAVHAAAWGAFLLARALARRGDGGGPKAAAPARAPYARAMVASHVAAMFVLYWGVGHAVIGRDVPGLFPSCRAPGAALSLAGGGLMAWAVLHFRSWRYAAALEAGHELATGGPFAVVRHPVYAGMDLVALGAALWVPTANVVAGALLVFAVGDGRARAEEGLLRAAFGGEYAAYAARTRRFFPGLY